MEVVEDKEASEQVKKLKARQALVSGQIEVSHSTQSIEVVDYAY